MKLKDFKYRQGRSKKHSKKDERILFYTYVGGVIGFILFIIFYHMTK